MEGLESNSVRERIRADIIAGFEASLKTPARETLERLAQLDMIVVHEGNTVVYGPDVIKPTSFRHADSSPQFDPHNDYVYIGDTEAMLGGGVRPMAAAQIAAGLGEQTPPVTFVGGNPTSKEKTHPVPHSGSEVYKVAYEKWLELYRANASERRGVEVVAPSVPHEPLVLHDSENSQGDIESALTQALARKPSGEIRIGFLSNAYHLPRLFTLFEEIIAKHPQFGARHIEFIPVSAEGTILSLAREGVKSRYLKLFTDAYAQASAHNRLGVESIGSNMIARAIYRSRPGKPAQESVDGSF